MPIHDFVQLDLFEVSPRVEAVSDSPTRDSRVVETLSDDDLIAAIPDGTLAVARAMTAEAAKRRLRAAAPALTALCNRFAGYGANVIVPEQVDALEALGVIGGPDASRAVTQLIVKMIVQGPTLAIALRVASQLGVFLPKDNSLALLRHADPAVRAAACGCARSGPEVAATLILMLDDTDEEVAIASACALGRAGRREALVHLKNYLIGRPSLRVVEALEAVADDETISFLARTGRARRELTASIVSVLEGIETPRALAAASALKRSSKKDSGASATPPG